MAAESSTEPKIMTVGGVQVRATISLGQVVQIALLLVVATTYAMRIEGRVNLAENQTSVLERQVNKDQASTDSQLVELRGKSAAMDVAIARIETNSAHTLQTVTRIERELRKVVDGDR